MLLICNRLIILSLTDRLCDLRVENVDSFNIVANLYILGSRQIVSCLAVESIIFRLVEPLQKHLCLILHTGAIKRIQPVAAQTRCFFLLIWHEYRRPFEILDILGIIRNNPVACHVCRYSSRLKYILRILSTGSDRCL